MSCIFGIDLGTTNSCIAWLNEGKPEVISIDDSAVVPSVVSFSGQEIIVGHRARNRAFLYPEETISSVKRMMGLQAEVPIRDRSCSPEEVSSHILGYLKSQAQKACGTEVRRAVITVPAYFSDAQRRATQKAGELAGLKVERILNEPTAAALFYEYLGLNEPAGQERNILVYDLGGGTFDVSCLCMSEITEVLSSRGNTGLGGDDFDRAVMERCLERIRGEHGRDLRESKPALARLKHAAEHAKITLSDHPFARILEPMLPVTDQESINLDMELPKSDFETDIQSYLETTRHEVQQALKEAGLSAQSIHEVLPVGGSTRVPAVTRLLEEEFGRSKLPVVDPDLSVAKGAAIQGAIISGSRVSQILIDVTPHSLSTAALVDAYNDVLQCVPIIPRNAQIPVTRSEVFFTIADNQQRVEITVYQGESEVPDENSLIGTVDLALVPAPAGSPVVIEYAYDLNGIIRVTVEQKGYSRKREVNLDSSLRNQNFVLVDFEDDGYEDEPVELGDDPKVPNSGAKEQSQVTNYILQKARSLMERLEARKEESELPELIEDYEQALLGDDENEVDEAEEILIEYLEALEEQGW
jgi:molecular chaperone DnaK